MTYAYQWYYCDSTGAKCAPIAGYTQASYTPVADDVGGRNKVLVTAKNGAGSATAWSALTNVVVAASAPAPAPTTPTTPTTDATAPTLDTAPAVSGTPQQGQTLTASTGAWKGTAPMTYAYQWFYCDSTGGNCAPIVGYTQSTYKPVVYDVGGRNKVRVTATNGAGSAQAFSALTAVVTAAPEVTRPVNTTAPAIAGTAQVGKSLSASAGTWMGAQPIGYKYQWRRCASGTCTAISGATSTSYAPISGDVGTTLKVDVTATNLSGTAAATSATTSPVASASTTTTSTAGAFWSEEFSQNPASFWSFAYGTNNGAGFPNPGATLQNGALRLGNPPNSPGGQGILSAMWTGGSPAHGTNGQEYWVSTRFRFDSLFNGWILEQHENFSGSRDIYSNAIGIGTDRKLRIQRTGGEVSAHPSANGWQTTDTQTLVPGQWYTLMQHVKWSPGSDGFMHIYLDGRRITTQRDDAPTLLTENGRVDYVVFGIYAYPFTPQAGQTWVEFDNLAMGPTRESVGG